ncbi:transglycosylase [Staphylococcus borealis]|uniref:aggregation-promoting factor C-terminal-like domain-containing protein n=1 Tax=Staphylococcus borealis TaxID=2742203 RepID=UPI0039E86FB5
MKKTVIASSLAVALGVTGYALTTDNSAHASESTTNYAQLANLAQNNPSELNAHPVQAGAYNISFVKDGFEYNFTSDGQSWSWNYTYVGGADTVATTQAAPAAQSTDYSASYSNEASSQSVSSNQQSSNTSVRTVSAPTTTSYSASSASTGGSVKAQFLANGGTEAAWNAIVMPESGGNPNAVNPAGYRGLGQTMESWGTGSVAQQTKGMINYANSRYGSLDAAIAFRNNNGWW